MAYRLFGAVGTNSGRGRESVLSGSLETDGRWPRFAAQVKRLDVHSVVAVPLTAAGDTIGALNIYAHAPDAFAERDVLIGEYFSAPAAVSVQNAQLFAEIDALATRLRTALHDRAVIDQACGVLMSRSGCHADEAMEQLRDSSRSNHLDLRATAAALLAEAVRRATARAARDS